MAALTLAPFPTCPMRLLLRTPCPGCGVTRACELAARGGWRASLHLHPLALVSAALVAVSVPFVARDMLRKDVLGPLPRPLGLAWHVLVGLLIALWIARFFGYFGGPVPV